MRLTCDTLLTVVLLFGRIVLGERTLDDPHEDRWNAIDQHSRRPSSYFRKRQSGADVSSFLHANPLFAGQIIGGKVTGALSEEITEESISLMTNCNFFKQSPHRCRPTDPTTPCRYCKGMIIGDSKQKG